MAYNRDKVDRDLLHQYLWHHRDRMNMIPWKTNELATKLGITVYSMSVIYREMTDEGRLKKLGNSKYIIIDPSLHRWGNPANEDIQNSFF
jgi:hypothetical protein